LFIDKIITIEHFDFKLIINFKIVLILQILDLKYEYKD